MNINEFKIDENKCIKCGMCVKDCICNCLEQNKDTSIPQFVKGKEYNCIKCQHCLAICPTGALSILGKNPDNSFNLKDTNPNSEDILSVIRARRSFRQYKPENLDSERMTKIKEVLKYAPTGVNFHNMHFAIVDDIEVMDSIRTLANKKAVKLLNNPIIKHLFPHFRGMGDAIAKGHDLIFRGAPHMVIVSVPTKAPCKREDPVIALSSFDLYAQSLGVGTLWCGFAYYCFKIFPELCKYIEVPDGYRVSYVMLFGKPDIKYSRSTQPEEYNISNVPLKSNVEQCSILENLKRIFWNL